MKPAMARSRLVLPAPFAPVSATASPADRAEAEALEQAAGRRG